MKSTTQLLAGGSRLLLLALLFVPSRPSLRAAEVLLYDGTFTTTTNDHGFGYFKPVSAAGTNWLTPANFYAGEFHIRYEVLDYPSGKPFKLSVCIWADVRRDNGKWTEWRETCAGQVPIAGKGIFTQHSTPAAWWCLNKQPVDFARVRDFERLGLVVWNADGRNLSDWVPPNLSSWDQANEFLPLTVRVTLVGVSPGAAFSGWQRYVARTDSRRVLSFERVEIDAKPPSSPYIKLAGDFNQDGRLDIAIAGSKGPLIWYANSGWAKIQVAESGWKTVGGAVGDVDGDGDPDLVPGAQVWFENPLPKGDPAKDSWPLHRISDITSHDVALADLDGDGRLDVVARDQSGFNHNQGNQIHFWRQAAPDRWEHHSLDCPHGEGLALADLDRDGDLDVVIGGRWFENTGRIATAWPQHLYTTQWTWADAKLAVGDLNGDGRTDIVLAPAEYAGQTYRIAWYEAPSNPRRPEWAERIVVPSIESVVHGLQVVDMDGDGQLDIVSAQMHQGAPPQEVAVFVNSHHGVRWSKQVLATTGSHDILVADFNGDGRPDILGANHAGAHQPVELWLNRTSPPPATGDAGGAPTSASLPVARSADDARQPDTNVQIPAPTHQ